MGFNVGVCAKGVSYQENLFVFINRSYYHFVASYETFGEESVLAQTGEYLGLDLEPLARLVYTLEDVPEEYIEESLQNTEDMLALAQSFYQKVKEHPEVFQQISYRDGWSGNTWKEYASSGQVYKDLESLIKAIQVYKDAGYEQIFFDAG
jgi:hypothetical protein